MERGRQDGGFMAGRPMARPNTLSVLQGGMAPPHGRLPILGQASTVPERADAARNRQRILDAARKLLGRRPISEICMDELAAAAGVGKGTLYRRFTDRASLCRALLDDNERNLQARVIRGFDLPAATPPLRRLEVLLDALFDFTQENAALLAEALAFDRGQGNRFNGGPHHWRITEVSRHLQAAMDQGAVAPGDAELLAHHILGALDPDLLLFHRANGVQDTAQREAFHRMWRHGVAGPAR